MSDDQNSGFGQFVPGFDFLQNLARGATQSAPQMPDLSSWVAPTLNLEEVEKRIAELRSVHFWLEQNAKALAATIQALEVQKMTLATLKGMNFSMADLAEAFKLKPAAAPAAASSPAEPAGAPAAGVVDPLQWWGALTRQFQDIASQALKDAAQPDAPAAPAPKAAAAKAASRRAAGARPAPARQAAAKNPARGR